MTTNKSREAMQVEIISRQFSSFEAGYNMGNPGGKTQEQIAHYSTLIEKGYDILQRIHDYKLGNSLKLGIIDSQTALYILLLINKRVEIYWREGFIHRNGDLHSHYTAIVEDFHRSKNLSEEWDINISVSSHWVVHCYVELSQFQLAFEIMEQLCLLPTASSDDFMLLSKCYYRLPDFRKAIEAVTEALKRAINNSVRADILEERARMYKKIGENKLAAIDEEMAQQLRG